MIYLLGVLGIITVQHWLTLTLLAGSILLIIFAKNRFKRVWQGLRLASPFLLTAALLGLFHQKGGMFFAGLLISKLVIIVFFNSLIFYSFKENDLVLGLNQLRVPSILSKIIFFTLRYRQVLKEEMGRLRLAREIRGGRVGQGFNRKGYTILGQVMGAGLIRSLDRGDQVYRAMRLRGLNAQTLINLRGRKFVRTDGLWIGFIVMLLGMIIFIDRSGLLW